MLYSEPLMHAQFVDTHCRLIYIYIIVLIIQVLYPPHCSHTGLTTHRYIHVVVLQLGVTIVTYMTAAAATASHDTERPLS